MISITFSRKKKRSKLPVLKNILFVLQYIWGRCNYFPPPLWSTIVLFHKKTYWKNLQMILSIVKSTKKKFGISLPLDVFVDWQKRFLGNNILALVPWLYCEALIIVISNSIVLLLIWMPHWMTTSLPKLVPLISFSLVI